MKEIEKENSGVFAENLLIVRIVHISGTQRIYRVGNWGLSLVNGSMLHHYKFAWEAAIIHFVDDPKVSQENCWTITYKTPLSDDVEIFLDNDETERFLKKAFKWFKENPTELRTMKSVKADREARRKKMQDLSKSLAEDKARRAS